MEPNIGGGDLVLTPLVSQLQKSDSAYLRQAIYHFSREKKPTIHVLLLIKVILSKDSSHAKSLIRKIQWKKCRLNFGRCPNFRRKTCPSFWRTAVFYYSGAPKTRTCFYAKNSDIDQDLADTFFCMKTAKVTKYLQKVRFRVLKLAFQTMVVKNDLSLVVSDGHF